MHILTTYIVDLGVTHWQAVTGTYLTYSITGKATTVTWRGHMREASQGSEYSTVLMGLPNTAIDG